MAVTVNGVERSGTRATIAQRAGRAACAAHGLPCGVPCASG
ncbi:hypothetical protein BDSB_23995 [Burkholderia dolosa PC543]|nr:hypothetical protein BDSB_23995 [Burkholderia dolosa PC543]